MSLNSRLKDIQIVEGIVFHLHPSELFAVSCCGKILGKTLKILKPRSNGRYLIVSYYIQNTKLNRNKYVHRLVAETFLENPENLTDVNHKDGNKLNNHVLNLEWVSRKENMKHARDTGLVWNLPSKGEQGFRKND
jgi:hypothetical protein